MSFAHLHVHTTYSLFDGLSSITELFEKAESLGQPGLAITDHGFLFGIPEFMKVAEKHPSVKPVIGCEIYLTDYYDHHIKDTEHKKYYHLILLAKNLTGYRNLLKICSEAAISGQYRGRPRVSHEYLEQHHEGLIALSACIGGEIPQRILQVWERLAKKEQLDFLNPEHVNFWREYMAGNPDTRIFAKDILPYEPQVYVDGEEMAILWYKDVFGDDFYLEVSQHESRKPGYGTELLEMQKVVNEGIFALGKKFGIKVVATNDVHFVNAEDASAQDTLLCSSTGKLLSDKKRLCYTGEEYLKSEEQMLEIFPEHPEAISNTIEVLDKIERFSIWSKPQLPQYPIPEKFKDADEALRAKVYWHLEDSGRKGNEEYEERIEKELSMIRERHCADYFLIVSDLCEKVWEKGGIVGPGRGSAASLLVNYLIGITEVNPMEFGLLQERFFSYNLDILPDIDIEFDEKGQEIAAEYLTEKYGADHIARLGSYVEYSAKATIKASFKAHGLGAKAANKFCKPAGKEVCKYFMLHHKALGRLLQESPVKEIYQKATKEEKAAFDDAVKIEGGIHSIGVHSCGWLLSRDPITDYVPLTLHTDSETGQVTVISQYDSHFAEDCGPVEMDFLSLPNLEATVLPEPEDLNDRETMELFAKGDTVGVSQFETESMKMFLRKVKPEKFEHLVALNALYRPGPMDRIGMYASLKNGLCLDSDSVGDNPFTNLHKYTDETFGMIIYQEQLMNIVSEVASFTLEDLRRLRRCAGPFKMQQMIDGQWVDVQKYLEKKFIKGGVSNGYDRNTLKQFWNGFIHTYNAAYLFNKSHAVCYTLIAYRLAYLKAHDPALFYNTLYGSMKWDDDRKALYDDALKHGLVYMEKTGEFYTVIDD